MAISLTYNFDTMEELQKFVQEQKAKLPANDGSAPTTPAVEGKRGPGRPPKNKPAGQPDPEPKQTDLVEEAAKAVPTQDEMVQALTKLNQKHGIAAVREVLAEFGCQKVSEPKEDQRAAVIAKAEAKLAA